MCFEEYTLEEELELMREEIIGDAIEQVRKQIHGEFINQCSDSTITWGWGDGSRSCPRVWSHASALNV